MQWYELDGIWTAQHDGCILTVDSNCQTYGFTDPKAGVEIEAVLLHCSKGLHTTHMAKMLCEAAVRAYCGDR